MAHWAEIDENNIVTRVLVSPNEETPEQNHEWLVQNLGGTWLQTSYNTFAGIHTNGGTPLRKNYAGIGFNYDEIRDAFIPPKPYQSWELNEDSCVWKAPITMPTDDKQYIWDESTISWVEISTE